MHAARGSHGGYMKANSQEIKMAHIAAGRAVSGSPTRARTWDLRINRRSHSGARGPQAEEVEGVSAPAPRARPGGRTYPEPALAEWCSSNPKAQRRSSGYWFAHRARSERRSLPGRRAGGHARPGGPRACLGRRPSRAADDGAFLVTPDRSKSVETKGQKINSYRYIWT
jgi:hypothetical protein